MFKNVNELLNEIERSKNYDNTYLIDLNFDGRNVNALIGFDNKARNDLREDSQAIIVGFVLKTAKIMNIYLNEFLEYSWLRIVELKLEEKKISITVENNNGNNSFELSIVFEKIELFKVKEIKQNEYLSFIKKAKDILANYYGEI